MSLTSCGYHVLLVIGDIDTNLITARPGQYICVDVAAGGYPWVSDTPEFFESKYYMPRHLETYKILITKGLLKIAQVMHEA